MKKKMNNGAKNVVILFILQRDPWSSNCIKFGQFGLISLFISIKSLIISM